MKKLLRRMIDTLHRCIDRVHTLRKALDLNNETVYNLQDDVQDIRVQLSELRNENYSLVVQMQEIQRFSMPTRESYDKLTAELKAYPPVAAEAVTDCDKKDDYW